MKFDELTLEKPAPVLAAPKTVKFSDVESSKPVKFADIKESDPGFFGTFHPWKALTEEGIIPHVYQGFKRLIAGEHVTPAEALLGAESAKAIRDNPNNMTDTIKALGTFAKEHPGQFMGELANSIVADPELLFIPYGGEAGLGAKLALKLGTMGMKAGAEAGKALAFSGKVLGAGLEGAAIGAGIEGADQFAKGEYSLGDLKGPANLGAAMGAGGAMLGKLVPGAGTVKKLFGKSPELRGTMKFSEAEAAGQQATREAENLKAMGGLTPPGDVFGAQPGAPIEPAPKVAVGMKRMYTAGDETNTWFTTSLEEAKARGEPTYIDVQDTGAYPHKDFSPIKNKPGMFESKLPVDSAKLRPLLQPRLAVADMVKTHTPEPLKARLKGVAKSALAGGAIGAGAGIAAQGLGGIDSGEWPYGAAFGAAVGIVPRLAKALSPRRGHDIGEVLNRNVGENAVYERNAANGLRAINELVPVEADRNAITTAMATGAIDTLPPKLKEAAEALRSAYDEFGQKALQEGEIEHIRENYVPRIVESTDPNIKIFNSFSAGSKFPTFQEFVESLTGSGLKLKSMDASVLFKTYSDAMFTTLTNRRMIEALKDVRMPDGAALIVPKSARGPHYVESPSSRLSKYAVHRDIADQLRLVFDASSATERTSALQRFTAATKNLAVMGSLFHAKTLLDGWIGAAKWRNGEALRPGAGIDAGIEAFRKAGPQGQLIDDFLRNGLKVGATDDSQAHALNEILQSISTKVDKALPGNLSSGEAFKKVQDFNTGLHKFTFEYLQTGMKVRTALSSYERLISKGFSHEQATKAASSFVNDIYGGQNWVHLANSAQSDIMNRLANHMMSPGGRRMSQLMLFAPDWTVSTFRSAYKALPGAAETPELASLHRNYMLKASISYLVLANMLNYAAVGHSIFENKDPTKVNLGDGMRLTLSKHFLEPFAWTKDPAQEFMNKLAGPVKSAAEIIAGKEYLSKSAPDIAPGPLPYLASAGHLAKGLVPIPAQGLLSGFDPIRMAGSFLGIPETGMRPDEKSAAKAAGKEARKASITIGKARREPD